MVNYHFTAACAIALPYCMKYNLPVNTPILARIARAMDDNILGTPEEMAENGIHAVRKLIVVRLRIYFILKDGAKRLLNFRSLQTLVHFKLFRFNSYAALSSVQIRS